MALPRTGIGEACTGEPISVPERPRRRSCRTHRRACRMPAERNSDTGATRIDKHAPLWLNGPYGPKLTRPVPIQVQREEGTRRVPFRL